MVRSVPVLIVVSVLAAPSGALAACQFLGSQFECALGTSRVVIGTQAADDAGRVPAPAPPPPPSGAYRPENHAALPFDLELQDVHPEAPVGADLSFCREIEDETYCE